MGLTPKTSRSHPRGGRSMALDIMIWLAFSLVTVHVIGGLWAHYMLKQRFMQQLEQDASSTASTLATALESSIWNLDPDRIDDYLLQHPLPRDIARLVVRDQFHDLLYQRDYGPDGPSVPTCVAVNRQSELIGTITVHASLGTVEMAEKFFTEMSFWDIVTKLCISLLAGLIIVQLFVRRPFRRLGGDLQKIGAGDYSHRIAPMLHSEFVDLSSEVNLLASRIEERNADLKREVIEKERAHDRVRRLADVLEVRIAKRTEDLETSNQELRHSLGERRRIQRELDEASSREQGRIGKLLHDSLGQQMAGISFLASSLSRMLLDAQSKGHTESARIAALAQEAMAQTRMIARGLAPIEPGEKGLQLSLARLLTETESIYGIRCRLSNGNNVGTPDESVSSQLYLIAQEAINNAVRHSKGSEINVRLSLDETDGILIVQDNGVGFVSPASDRTGMGLHTMHYRADQLGGRLDILALERGGTSVSVKFPLHPPRNHGD